MSILAWIVLGLIAGFIGSKIFVGSGQGMLMDIVLGIVGAVVGGAMAVMFVQILSPLFTIPPASLTIPTGQLAVLATLVLGGMGLSVLLAARSLRRLNPVELLREE